IAFLESKCEYRDGERIPIRPATSRRVTADSPSCRAISHAASRISRLVASRRSARLSRLGKALMVRSMRTCCLSCQGADGDQLRGLPGLQSVGVRETGGVPREPFAVAELRHLPWQGL